MQIKHLGKIDYNQALEIQLKLLEDVLQGEQEKLLVCSHDPVVTLGKQSTPADLCGWKGLVIETSRGGQATYHGPGQIICYPIINISKRNNDIHWYLRSLESAMLETLLHFGIVGQGNPDGTKQTTGVWVKQKKIASIGIGIKRWITYHGLALNFHYDSMAFKGINPCGYGSDIMTSLEEIEGSHQLPKKEVFQDILTSKLITHLKC